MVSVPPGEVRSSDSPPSDEQPSTGGTPVAATPIVDSRRGLRRGDLLALAVLAAVLIALPVWYVSRERAVYASDYSGYYYSTISTALELRARLGAGVRAMLGLVLLVARSTGWDYGLLPTVLPAPVMLALHGGRITYIVTCALLYLMPLALLVGALASSLVPRASRAAFWAGVGITVTTPAFWVPALRGYPDAGAAALAAAAMLLYVRDSAFRSRWTAPGIALCLVAAILFRRHFAYPALSLLAVIGARGVLSLVTRWRVTGIGSWRAARTDEMSGALRTALWCFGFMLLLGLPFVVHALGNDFISLYASYMLPPRTIVDWFAWSYGWTVWCLAAVGFVLAWRWRTLDRRRLGLVLGVYVLTLLVWILRVRQAGQHYMLHALPLVVLGLFALGWTIASRMRGTSRWLLAAAAVGFAALNLARGLAPEATVPAPLRATPLLAGANPPLFWPDYEELLRLVRDLRRSAGPSDQIYVASSKRLSSSSLRSADRMLDDPFAGNHSGGKIWLGGRLDVPHTPHIDSRDENPAGALMRASYVVVADPVQYHLRPEQQRLVRAVVDAFEKRWELVADFAPLPTTYSLEDGATVHVYHRVRPASLATALRTFARLRAFVPRSAEPNPLLYVGSRQDVETGPRNGGELTAVIPLGSDRDTIPLILTHAVPPGAHLRAEALLDGTACGRLVLSAAPLAGDSIPTTAMSAAVDGGAAHTLDLPLRGGGSAALILVWREAGTGAAGAKCTMTLRDVKLVGVTAQQ
jgi:hypothetical protein